MSRSSALRERSLDLADLTIPGPLRPPIDPTWNLPPLRLAPAIAPCGPRALSLSSDPCATSFCLVPRPLASPGKPLQNPCLV